MTKLILLDRDGVINKDRREGILKREWFELLPRTAEAIALLKQAGFTIAICTNQSAIGRGNLSLAEYDAINHSMQNELGKLGGHIDKIYCAPDPPEAATDRRKPGPGMLLEALHEFHAQAAHTYFVGDMLRDAQAAHHAGCPFILVRTGKGEKTIADGIPEAVKPVAICADLYDAAEYAIANQL